MTNIEINNSQRSWTPIAIGIAFAIIALFSVYFGIRQNSLISKLEDLKTEKEKLETELKSRRTESTDTLMAVKKQLDEITNRQILWSKISEKIAETIPKLPETNEPIINLRSFMGNENGIISATATTRSDSADAFADTALFISAFANELSFKHVFVPSINKTITPEGAVVLSLSINFEYDIR